MEFKNLKPASISCLDPIKAIFPPAPADFLSSNIFIPSAFPCKTFESAAAELIKDR